MTNRFIYNFVFGLYSICSLSFLESAGALPEQMLKIMQQEKYQHATWGVYVKDTYTGEELLNYNGEKLFLPASTTKLFSTAALLNAYGEDYRFKTPVFALGPIEAGRLTGNLILVAQGDLLLGGRQEKSDKVAFTKMDHMIANTIPGALLTPEDPLYGLKMLAQQIKQKGINEINGDVLIDDRLFESINTREVQLSPIIINENLIDFAIRPTEAGQAPGLAWRPQVEGYAVFNELLTVDKKGTTAIEISSDPTGKIIHLKGEVSLQQPDLVRIFSIKDPNDFARAAFIQALRAEGIIVKGKQGLLPEKNLLRTLQPIAVFTSPPLSEYVKLILKVSHNLGADLIAPLLALKQEKSTFSDGLLELGKFTAQTVGISGNEFVFLDAAGGDGNRLTPKAEVQLLEYMKQQPKHRFNAFFQALPTLGIDGSLADFGKTSAGMGKVHAKTGTGIVFNPATNEFFLTTQALAGYVEGKDGHLLAFMIVVNNGIMPQIEDIFPFFEDQAQIVSALIEVNG